MTNKSYDYDASGRLIEAKTMDASMTQTAKDTFTYDGAGNRKQRIRITGSTTAYTSYAYNTVNQLCWRSNTNVAAPSCSSPPGGATSFSYDAAGNQTAGDLTAAYDDKGRLATLNTASITHLSPTNWELTAMGSSTFRNTILGATYVNIGGNINKIQRTPADGSAISQIRDSAKRWYVTDQIGSTIALVDSTGTVGRTYAYDTDGNATTTGTGPQTQFTYAGGHDLGGLIHYGHRYYQPSTGRWTQQDPLLQPADLGQANRYTYVSNNPMNLTDPAGLEQGCQTRGTCDDLADRQEANRSSSGDFNVNCAVSVAGLVGTIVGGPSLIGAKVLFKVAGGVSAGSTVCGTATSC